MLAADVSESTACQTNVFCSCNKDLVLNSGTMTIEETTWICHKIFNVSLLGHLLIYAVM